MKTKIILFVIGFVISWLTWSVVQYVRLRPRDYTASWAQADGKSETWLKSARGRRLGGFFVFTPADASNASALIHAPKPNQWPQIMITDENQDGRLDRVLIADSRNRHVTIADDNGDGVFDSHDYATGTSIDSVSYIDGDMDGLADTRFGPSNVVAFRIGSTWRDRVYKDKKHFVEIDGALKQVEKIGGVYKLREE